MRENVRLNIPNLISFGRLLLVPVTVGLLVHGAYQAAFWVFLVGSASDAVDGFIAKRFGAQTELGGYLDPIADKALLISVFVGLGQQGFIESWLVILVVFRDGLILCGAGLYYLLYHRLSMEPLKISKANTLAQFLLVLVVLAMESFSFHDGSVIAVMTYVVAATTLASGSAYVIVWSRRAMLMEPGE